MVIGPDGERTRVYGEDNTYASTESVRESQLGAEAVLPGGGGDAHGDFEAVEHDLSEYAGEQVTIKIETVGRATFEIDALKLGYDTDGDTLYDAVERGTCGLRDGRGQCLDTDPRLADTDGDGLSDSYEVGERQQVHGRVYNRLRSNPTVRDTDHDGLSDAQELRGFDTAVTRSPDASRKYLNGESPSDKAEHLTTEWTNSNPFAYDSDNDGLSDREEWLHKTDPNNPDSDGDGLLDGRERAVGEDPTLYDYRPPDIRLARYGYLANYSEMEIEYILEYLLFDPSGVEHTAVEKNGKTRYRASPNAVFSRHDGSFSVSGVSAVADELAGATVEVTATDSHGNRKKTVGIRKANAVGRLAGKLDADTMYATGAAEKLGALSGFSAGMGGTIKSLLGLVNDPLGFVKGLTGLIDLLDESGLLGMFLDAMVSSLQDKQKTNNPYAEGSALYDEYRNSWYAGYTVAFITKAIAGAQATKVIKSSTYAQKVSNFAKSTRAGKAAMRVKAPYDRGKARVATGLARATERASGPLLRRAKSAGAAYRLWRLQREGEVDTSDLSDIERDRVVRYLARHGADGAEDLRRMDDADFEALFGRLCGSGLGTQRFAGGGCTELSDRKQRAYSDAVTETDVDPSEFGARLDTTDVKDANARLAFAQTSRYGVRMASDLDDEALNQFVKLDTESQRLLVQAWRSESMDVSTADVDYVLKRMGSLDYYGERNLVQLVATTGGDGISLLRGFDDASEVQEFLTFTVDKSGYDVPSDLEDDVRNSLATSYGYNHISAEYTGRVTDDIRVLDGDERIEGVPEVLYGDPNGITNLPATPTLAYNRIKGSTYELRFARNKLRPKLDSGDTLRLDYTPDLDFSRLSDAQLEDIAKKVYGSKNDVEEVRDDLGLDSSNNKDPEFDGFKIDSDGGDVYYEAKNVKTLREEELKKKATFMFALDKLSSDVDDVRMVLYSGNEEATQQIATKIDKDWFTVRTYTVQLRPSSDRNSALSAAVVEPKEISNELKEPVTI
nr:hypothetical protein [Halorussus sp. DT72]